MSKSGKITYETCENIQHVLLDKRQRTVLVRTVSAFIFVRRKYAVNLR